MCFMMAYPEPIPPLRGKDAKEFLRRLETFTLTDEQKTLYKDALAFYRRMEPRSDATS